MSFRIQSLNGHPNPFYHTFCSTLPQRAAFLLPVGQVLDKGNATARRRRLLKVGDSCVAEGSYSLSLRNR